MRERESIQSPLDNPLYAEQQLEMGIRKALGKNVVFHHTVLRRDLGVVYGGLHINRGEAVAVKRKLVDEYKNLSRTSGVRWVNGKRVGLSQRQAHAEVGERKKFTEIVNLEEGQKYNSFDEGRCYTHGVNDGTHESKSKG